MSFGLSVGAISLLYLLIRRGAVSKLASYFFLVAPTTALIAWAMFGEHLGPVALAGMAVAALGVALVQGTNSAARGIENLKQFIGPGQNRKWPHF